MASIQVPSHIVLPTALHTHTIIFLHGLGSNPREFCSEIFESQDNNGAFFTQLFPSIKWVFPCATFLHIDPEAGNGRKWFDMDCVQDPQNSPEVQRPGLEESKTRLLRVIEEEAGEVGREKVILAGISQGCATAIYTLLTTGIRVGGFFGLCGWLPLTDEVQRIVKATGWLRELWKMPILLQHCVDDLIVPVENGEDLMKSLVGLGMFVDWQCFVAGDEQAHWLKEPEGMDGIVRFVKTIIEGMEE
jgi:predicted esterase